MEDYRGHMCLLDGKYLARCVGQDFMQNKITFEVEPDADQFDRHGDYGVEIYEEPEITFDSVKHRLPTIGGNE